MTMSMIIPKAENISDIASPSKIYTQLICYSRLPYFLGDESDRMFMMILNVMCRKIINLTTNKRHLALSTTVVMVSLRAE